MWKTTLVFMALSVSAVHATENCSFSSQQQLTVQDVATL